MTDTNPDTLTFIEKFLDSPDKLGDIISDLIEGRTIFPLNFLNNKEAEHIFQELKKSTFHNFYRFTRAYMHKLHPWWWKKQTKSLFLNGFAAGIINKRIEEHFKEKYEEYRSLYSPEAEEKTTKDIRKSVRDKDSRRNLASRLYLKNLISLKDLIIPMIEKDGPFMVIKFYDYELAPIDLDESRVLRSIEVGIKNIKETITDDKVKNQEMITGLFKKFMRLYGTEMGPVFIERMGWDNLLSEYCDELKKLLEEELKKKINKKRDGDEDLDPDKVKDFLDKTGEAFDEKKSADHDEDAVEETTTDTTDDKAEKFKDRKYIEAYAKLVKDACLDKRHDEDEKGIKSIVTGMYGKNIQFIGEEAAQEMVRQVIDIWLNDDSISEIKKEILRNAFENEFESSFYPGEETAKPIEVTILDDESDTDGEQDQFTGGGDIDASDSTDSIKSEIDEPDLDINLDELNKVDTEDIESAPAANAVDADLKNLNNNEQEKDTELDSFDTGDKREIEPEHFDISEPEQDTELENFEISNKGEDAELEHFSIRDPEQIDKLGHYDTSESQKENDLGNFDINEAEQAEELGHFDASESQKENELGNFGINEAKQAEELGHFDASESQKENELGNFDINEAKQAEELGYFETSESPKENDLGNFDINDAEQAEELGHFDISEQKKNAELEHFEISDQKEEKELEHFKITDNTPAALKPLILKEQDWSLKKNKHQLRQIISAASENEPSVAVQFFEEIINTDNADPIVKSEIIENYKSGKEDQIYKELYVLNKSIESEENLEEKKKALKDYKDSITEEDSPDIIKEVIEEKEKAIQKEAISSMNEKEAFEELQKAGDDKSALLKNIAKNINLTAAFKRASVEIYESEEFDKAFAFVTSSSLSPQQKIEFLKEFRISAEKLHHWITDDPNDKESNIRKKRIDDKIRFYINLVNRKNQANKNFREKKAAHLEALLKQRRDSIERAKKKESKKAVDEIKEVKNEKKKKEKKPDKPISKEEKIIQTALSIVKSFSELPEKIEPIINMLKQYMDDESKQRISSELNMNIKKKETLVSKAVKMLKTRNPDMNIIDEIHDTSPLFQFLWSKEVCNKMKTKSLDNALAVFSDQKDFFKEATKMSKIITINNRNGVMESTLKIEEQLIAKILDNLTADKLKKLWHSTRSSKSKDRIKLLREFFELANIDILKHSEETKTPDTATDKETSKTSPSIKSAQEDEDDEDINIKEQEQAQKEYTIYVTRQMKDFRTSYTSSNETLRNIALKKQLPVIDNFFKRLEEGDSTAMHIVEHRHEDVIQFIKFMIKNKAGKIFSHSGGALKTSLENGLINRSEIV